MFTWSTSRSTVFGSRSGALAVPVGPETFTVLTLPPRSASAVVTMFTALLTAFMSVPVQSTKMLRVDSVTAVLMPFMIGGKDRTSPTLSTIMGYLLLPSRTYA